MRTRRGCSIEGVPTRQEVGTSGDNPPCEPYLDEGACQRCRRLGEERRGGRERERERREARSMERRVDRRKISLPPSMGLMREARRGGGSVTVIAVGWREARRKREAEGAGSQERRGLSQERRD
jgi:hypothetical protein